MKFGTLLSDLAKKAGVDTTQQDFVSLLSHDIEIPDAIATKLNQGLLNIDAAKNNPDIKKALRAEALNGVDSKISELLEELGITSEATEILEEKNSFEKIAKLTRKVKDLESKKAGATKKEDKDALETKIADLNKELKTAKDSITAKEKEWQDLRNGDLTNFEIQKKLLGKEYALPKEMNADLKVTTAQSAINMALQAKGYKLVRNEQGSLQIVDKDGNKAYSDSHEELQVDSFIDGALAQNKLLKVNDQSQGGGGNSSTIIQNDGSGKGNASIVAEIDGALFK
jgi:NADH dehydrogenase/NADH:ubiquinone oxidoreductase subunit G